MTPPSEELSHRLLGTVPYEDRLLAGRLLPPVGIIPGDVRGLNELYLFLAPDEKSLPGVNLASLVDWVHRILGDNDLADGIRIVTHEAGSYAEGCLKVYELVGYRLAQAREVARQEVLT
jgi:hypothetical protein